MFSILKFANFVRQPKKPRAKIIKFEATKFKEIEWSNLTIFEVGTIFGNYLNIFWIYDLESYFLCLAFMPFMSLCWANTHEMTPKSELY